MADTGITINAGTPQQVALELTRQIDYCSRLDMTSKDKDYWLKLYAECLRVTLGNPPR